MTGDDDDLFFASLNLLIKVKLQFRGPSDLTTYRQQIDECRNHASTAIGQSDKEAWLKLAAKWEKLARNTKFTVHQN